MMRLTTLIEVEIAATAVHRLVGGAQMMGIGERMLGFAREALRLGREMLAVPEVRGVAAPVTLSLGDRPGGSRSHARIGGIFIRLWDLPDMAVALSDIAADDAVERRAQRLPFETLRWRVVGGMLIDRQDLVARRQPDH